MSDTRKRTIDAIDPILTGLTAIGHPQSTSFEPEKMAAATQLTVKLKAFGRSHTMDELRMTLDPSERDLAKHALTVEIGKMKTLVTFRFSRDEKITQEIHAASLVLSSLRR